MKVKNAKLIPLALLVVLVVLVGLGLWWFLSSSTANPPKAPSPPPAAAVPAKRVAYSTTIAAPAAPAAQPKPSAGAATTTTVATTSSVEANDPQTHLPTAIHELARLFHDGDFMEYIQRYTPPDKLTPEKLQWAREWLAKQTEDPGMQDAHRKGNESLAKGLEALENQTPTYNDTGDEATYMLYVDVVGNDPQETTFIKINGKWYLKEAE